MIAFLARMSHVDTTQMSDAQVVEVLRDWCKKDGKYTYWLIFDSDLEKKEQEVLEIAQQKMEARGTKRGEYSMPTKSSSTPTKVASQGSTGENGILTEASGNAEKPSVHVGK